jgi:hypothetical protein
MGRTQQMRRDLITVALIVSLLVAALLLTGSKEAFAQSAAEDQYSDPSSVPASPAPTSTPGSGGGSLKRAKALLEVVRPAAIPPGPTVDSPGRRPDVKWAPTPPTLRGTVARALPTGTLALCRYRDT